MSFSTFKPFKDINKSSILFFLLLGGCQKPLSLPLVKQKNHSAPWSVSESYRPPSFVDGPIFRILTLHGADTEQVYVDRQEEEEANWIQIGLTNEQGVFVDRDIDKKVRYRFAGKIVTPWYDPMKTVVIDSKITLPAKIEGFNCLVPSDATIYIQDKVLEINCRYITILGNIYSFRNPAVEDAAGLNAGKVKLIGEEIDLQGRIWLLGQDGGLGPLVNEGRAILRYRGQNAGAGGEIFLQYKNLYEVYEAFRFEGGRAGEPRFDPRTRTNGTLDGERGRLYRKKLAS